MNKKINIEKLKEARTFIKKIPANRINMSRWREYDLKSHKCNSIGCIIGFLTELIPKEDLPVYSNGKIDFMSVPVILFNITFTSNIGYFLFASRWSLDQRAGTKTQFLKRLDYIIKHQCIPSNWNVKNYKYYM